MKRTGSASCLLRPKNSLSQDDLQRLQRDPPTATVLTVNKLPTYSADRLYVQSELQVHSSLHVLNHIDNSLTSSVILYVLWNMEFTPVMFADIICDRVRQCLLQTGEEVDEEEWEQARCNPRLSHFSPRRQTMSESGDDLSFLLCGSLSHDETEKNEQSIRIYVVVDKVAPPKSGEADLGDLPNFPDLSAPSYEDSVSQCQSKQTQANDGSFQSTTDEHQVKLQQHNKEIKTAESLARAVSSSRLLRQRIDGLSIGITSDSRAAPGLEACMDAASRSSQERRITSNTKQTPLSIDDSRSLRSLRNRSPERSPISLVVCKPDDLDDPTSHTHHHHHHHQSNHLLQSRVTVEWNGKGDYNTFSDRAMIQWRKVWNESCDQRGKSDVLKKKKVPRLSRRDNGEEEPALDEPVSTIMVIVFVIFAAWYVYNSYGEYLYSTMFCDSVQQQCLKSG